jgi:hypothetical protein
MGVPSMKLLDSPDHLPDAFSLFVDPAIAKDLELPARMGVAADRLSGHLCLRLWRRRFRLRQRIKYLRVYSSRRSKTADSVFSLYPPAEAFGIAQQVEAAASNPPLLFVAFKDKIEKFRLRFEALELRKDGVFAANPDFEFFGRDRLNGPNLSPELQPVRLLPFRSEQDKAASSPDEAVSNLEVATDPAKDFNVGEQGGNLHVGMNVA